MSEYYCITTRRFIKSHCYAGHEYTPENTGVDSRGSRFCKYCARTNGRNRLRKFRIRQAIASTATP